MNRSFLHTLFAVTLLGTLFSFYEAKSDSIQPPHNKNKATQNISFHFTTPSGLPINNTRDEGKPHFNAAASVNSHSLTYYFRLGYQLLSHIQASVSDENKEKYRLLVQITLHNFFSVFFKDIISPNAP